MTQPIDLSTITLAERLKHLGLTRDIGKGHKQQTQIAIKRFGKFLGHVPTLADLTPEAVNGWLVAMQEEGLAKRSIRSYRGRILNLWNDAYDEGLIDVIPRRVRKIKLPRHTPVCWSQQEVSQLLAKAKQVRGRFQRNGILKARFWVAFILTFWDSAIRLGDLLTLRTVDLRGKQAFSITQSKTGQVVNCSLRPLTQAAIEATYPPEREFVFGGGRSPARRTVFVQFKRLVESAGLNTKTGGSKMLRKSSATAVEAAHPGAAMRHLGHRSADLAYRFYIDPRYINHAKPLPPALPPVPSVEGGGA